MKLLSLPRWLAAAAFVLLAGFASAAYAEAAPAAGGHGDAHAQPPINWLEFHYGKNVYGEPAKPGDKPMNPAVAFVLLNFTIFAGLLVFKAGPALSGYLQGRHTEVKESLEEAARLRSQAEKELAEYKAKVAGVDREVDKLVAEIRADAEAEKQRILIQAEQTAASLKKEAEQRIQAEIQRARVSLEQEVFAAAIGKAEQMLREGATVNDHAQLVDSFIAELGTTPPEQSR